MRIKLKHLGRNSLLFLVMCCGVVVHGQGFSLDEAQSYGVKYNYEARMAAFDIAIAKKRIREIIALGLPQVSAEGSFQHFIDIPTSLVPAQSFNPLAPADAYAAVQFGTEFNTNGQLSVSQLIFDGSYIVGVQASRVYSELKSLDQQKSQQKIEDDIALSYFMRLTLDESLLSMQQLNDQVEKLLTSTKKLNESGLVGQDVVDQLTLIKIESAINLENIQKQQIVTKNLFNFQLGLPLDTVINLTDSLGTFLAFFESYVVSNTPNFKSHIDVLRAEVANVASQLELRNEKAAFLPKLYAFFNHQQVTMGNEFKILSNEIWYPSTLWGVTLKVPIFTSGMRLAKVGQKRLAYEKSQVQLDMVKQGMLLQHRQAITEYEASLNSYRLSQQQRLIAKKVFEESLITYRQGMISNTDLTQRQQQYLQSELGMLNAEVKLFQTYIKLKRATN